MHLIDSAYQHALKMLSLSKLESLWPYLGLYLRPTPEIHAIFEIHIKRMMEYKPSKPWEENNREFLQQENKSFIEKTVKDLFDELNTIKQAYFVNVGDAVRGWIELDFIALLELHESQPWMHKWRSILYRIGNPDMLGTFPRPEFLQPEKLAKISALSEELYRRENLLGRIWADINPQDWVGWDKQVYISYDVEIAEGDLYNTFDDFMLDLDDYMEIRNFLEFWPKVISIMDKSELLELNKFGLEAIKSEFSTDWLKENPNYLDKISIPK